MVYQPEQKPLSDKAKKLIEAHDEAVLRSKTESYLGNNPTSAVFAIRSWSHLN